MNAGLLAFGETVARMALLLHGQIDTFTKTLCGPMGTGTSRTSCSNRTLCRKKASPSCSTVSKGRRPVQSGLHRTSTSSRHLSSATTVSCSLRIRNKGLVSIVHHVVSPSTLISWCRPGRDRHYRTLQGAGQNHSGVIETGKLVGNFGGLSRAIPGTS